MLIDRRTLLSLLGLAALAYMPMAAAAKPIEPHAVVDKILQAYGGRDALERVKAVRHVGSIQSQRLNKTGRLERLFVLPDQLRVELDYPGGPHEQRITTAQGAWRDGQPATEPMHLAMELQAARFRLPLLLSQYPLTVLNENGEKLHLGMKLTPTTALEVIVDRHSWRIERSIGSMFMGGMNMSFTADYADFRSVDGVLFAYREELTAMGMATGIVELERIEVNPKEGAVVAQP